MTFPNTPTQGSTSTNPEPKPKPLTDEELRLECLKLVAPRVEPKYITTSADRLVQYVKTGAPNTGANVARGEGA